jgi:hypothetical protein
VVTLKKNLSRKSAAYVMVNLSFFYLSGSFISVVIYDFATVSATDVSSYTTTNTGERSGAVS